METATADTQLCENCKKMVSKANYSLHSVHCQRNIILCKICKEPYPKNEIDAHINEAHTKITCDKCGKEIERQAAEKHELNECPKRLVKCHLCELDIPDCTMDDHIDYCGSRTERCDTCGQYVMLKFMDIHLSSNHSFLTFDDKSNSPLNTRPRLDLVNDHYSTSVFPRTITGSRLPTAAGSLLNDFEYAHGHAFEDLISEPVMPSQDIAENIERLLNLDDINPAFVSGQPRRPVVTEDDDDLHLQDFGHFEERHYRRLDHTVTFPTANTRVPEIAEHDDRIPCEFCGELFDTYMISEHQETCEVSMSRTIPIDELLVEDAIHQPDDITLIPCEYCDKTFNSEFIIEHQSGCDKAPPQPPEFIDVDSRPPIRAERIVPRPTSPQPSPQITAQHPISLVDDDMDYINDMFLKEAIENSLMEKNNKRENGVQSQESFETPNVSTSLSFPRVRNIPIRIEAKPSPDMLMTSRSEQGKQRGQARSVVQHLHENGSSQERRHTTGTRPKNAAYPDNSQSSDYVPKPPARRHRDQ